MSPEQVDRVHELAVAARHEAASLMNRVNGILDIAQREKGLNGGRPVVPRVLSLLLVGFVSLLAGSSYHRHPMATSKAEMEMEYTNQAEAQAASGDFQSVILTGQKLQDSGFKAVGFYWEGLGNYNLGKKEAAAHFFSRSAKMGYPLAMQALEESRK